MHRLHAYRIRDELLPASLLSAARQAWDDAVDFGRSAGYRNAQASVLAPTGTISFMMDCDTTGVEPDIALVKYKKLVGGGMLKLVNGQRPLGATAPRLQRHESGAITTYIEQYGTIEGAPGIKDHDLAVFDCAFKPQNGERTIHHMGHIKMMGAVQPFISGAISKTVNLPETASVDDVSEAYVEAWKHGLKAIAIYRDGSKKVQPVNHEQQREQHQDGRDGRGADRRGHAAAAPPPRRHAGIAHAQVQDRRARGLHHRRALRGQHPRRALRHHGEEARPSPG